MVKNLLNYLNRGPYFTILSLFFIVLYTISLFFNLGVAPFYNEEPRRSIIAMEMLFNNNPMVTTVFNEVFYDHPPLWYIVLALSAKTFGANTEFAFRFPCALSLLITGVVIYYMGKKYVGQLFGLISAFLYLISADLYFFFSNTAEIDIFFSLLVLLSAFSIFHFYEQKRFALLFLSAYFFCFLGFMTKGVVAIAFLGITLMVFFAHKKDFKNLFLPIHFLSALLCLGSILSFFLIYDQFDDAMLYWEGMWHITKNKSFLDKENNAFISHFIWFPINMLGNLFPATLFIVFLFKKGVIPKIKKNGYIIFLLLFFFSNFLVYWISPGAKARYTYMFYPVIISLLTYVFIVSQDKKNKSTTFILNFLALVSLILGVACIALPFIDFFKHIQGLIYFGPLLGACVLILFFLQIKTANLWNKLILGLMGVVAAKLAFSLVVSPLKQFESSASRYKQHAINILEIVKESPILLYSNIDAFGHHKIGKFYITGAYLELLGNRPLKKATYQEKGQYYILHKEELNGQKVLYTIDDVRSCLVLVKNEEGNSGAFLHTAEQSPY